MTKKEKKVINNSDILYFRKSTSQTFVFMTKLIIVIITLSDTCCHQNGKI